MTLQNSKEEEKRTDFEGFEQRRVQTRERGVDVLVPNDPIDFLQSSKASLI